ncbi:MAG: hypothetical protein WAO76_10070 [Georgfuchsia sp.]
MSPLSTESLSVFLSPAELVAVHWRGLPRQIVDKRSYPVTAHAGNDWAGAIEALATVLHETACQRLRVILSCHFTHYLLAPWRDDLNDNEEELAAARLMFADTFGDIAARWSIRLSDEPPGTARVAAAVETELIGAIEQTAKTTKTHLISVQPYLAAAANSWRKHFDQGRTLWLVLQEENRACLALIEQGRWRWIRCVRIGADWPQRLPELVEHEALLANSDAVSTEVLVFAPGHPELTIPVGTRLPFRQLRLEARTGFSPISDGRFGFALVG